MDQEMERRNVQIEYDKMKKTMTGFKQLFQTFLGLLTFGIIPFWTVYVYGKNIPEIRKNLKPGFFFNSLRDPYVDRIETLITLFPLMLCACGSFIGVRKLIDMRVPMEFNANSINPRLLYMTISGVLFISFLFGIESVFPIAWVLLNYIVLMIACYTKLEIIIWIFNLLMLFLTHNITYNILPTFLHQYSSAIGLGWRMGGYFIVLRILSYDIDYYQHFFRPPTPRSSHSQERHLKKCILCLQDKPCNSVRAETSLEDKYFSPLAYAAYVLYAPTYIGGPTISFTGFMSHWVLPTRAYDQVDQIKQCATYLGILVFFLICQHFFYLFEIINYWKQEDTIIPNSPWLIWCLNWLPIVMDYVIMKLLWEFFRLWAMLDGIEVPDNLPLPLWYITGSIVMWRVWHASYNLWLIRYIYIPLGGSRGKIRNTFLVFAFVLYTHDPHGDLLKEYAFWAFSMAVLVVVEGIITANGVKLFQKIFGNNRPSLQYYAGAQLHMCCVYFMVIANAITFCFRSVELEAKMGQAIFQANGSAWFGIFIWHCVNTYSSRWMITNSPKWEKIKLKFLYVNKKAKDPLDSDLSLEIMASK